MKRLMIAFLPLFLFACVLTAGAEELKTSDGIVLPPVPEVIAELRGELKEIENEIEQFREGKHPGIVKLDKELEKLKENAEKAAEAVSEIEEGMKKSWERLPEAARNQLLERLVKDPNLKTSSVRNLCPDEVPYTDFTKMVNDGKRFASIIRDFSSARLALEEYTQKRNKAESSMLEDFEKKAEEKKVEIEQAITLFRASLLLKLMEDCPGFHRIDAEFPFDEIVSRIPALEQYEFGWKEKELVDDAEIIWNTCRPCVPKPGIRMVKTADGIEYAFRWCPAGTFTMGNPEGESGRYDSETPYMETFMRGFWMLETEVTQAMWQSVMGKNPSDFKGDRNPVECVSWNDCQEFCSKLSAKLGVTVSLPTEAQWAYACRADVMGGYAGNLDEMAWYLRNSGCKTRPVGQKQPNAWGLYDMYGNVWEWCLDTYESDFYTKSPTSAPKNFDGSSRVLRGGSWYLIAGRCCSAYRYRVAPSYRGSCLGLRIVWQPAEE